MCFSNYKVFLPSGNENVIASFFFKKKKVLIPPTSDADLKAVRTVSHSCRCDRWITLSRLCKFTVVILCCRAGKLWLIVTAARTTTTGNVRNIGNSSEMWSDGHFVCTQAKKKKMHSRGSALMKHFPGTITRERPPHSHTTLFISSCKLKLGTTCPRSR